MFKLVKISLRNFIYNHKVLFVFLTIIQIISLLAIFLLYNIPVGTSEADKEYYDVAKQFVAHLDNKQKNQEIINKTNEIIQNSDIDISSVRIYDDESMISFDFFLQNKMDLTIGRYFTKEEFLGSKSVFISGDIQGENRIIGEKYTFDNKAYEMIGFSGLDSSDIFPISFFDNISHNNNRIKFTLKNYPTREEFKDFSMLLKEVFQEQFIEEPDRIEVSSSFDLTQLIFIGMLILAMVNIAFVYQYVLNNRKTLIQVIRLCGGTKKKCLFVFLSEMALISIVVFLISSILSHYLLPIVIKKTSFGMFTYALNFKHYVSAFFIYLVVLILIFIPFIKKTIGKVSISKFN